MYTCRMLIHVNHKYIVKPRKFVTFSFTMEEQSVPGRKIQKLHHQSDQINQVVKVLYNVKKEIISKIEEIKLKIRHLCTHKTPREKRPSIVVKDKTLSLLDSASDEVVALMREIKREFDRSLSLLSLKILDSPDFAIPEDISHIQNLHDVVVQDLETLRNSLNSHIAIVEKTELIMNILNYKIYDIQHLFRTHFNKFKEEKELLTKQPPPEKNESAVAIRLFEIDDEITKLEETHQRNLDSIKEQKLDAQKAYEQAIRIMDENFGKLTSGLDKLLVLIEAEKSSLSESQAQLVDSKFVNQINQFKADIETFTELQTTGWKVIYPEEKISEMLHQRGLKILHSGHLITSEGQRISFQKAKDSKLLDDITPDVLQQLRANIINGDDTNQSSSNSSIGSRMSSEDMNYLKQCLGKPLVLALAEITARQPRDPIHYLGHWLFKYRYNQQIEDINNVEFEVLNTKRASVAKEKWHKFIEEEARMAVMDMILHAEEIAIMNQLRRIELEEEAMEEMDGLDDEARDTLGPYNGPSTGMMPL